MIFNASISLLWSWNFNTFLQLNLQEFLPAPVFCFDIVPGVYSSKILFVAWGLLF